MSVEMFRPNLTKEIIREAKMNGKPLLVEMIECMSMDWSVELYCDYLSQFFNESSIAKVIIPIWVSLK